MAGDERRRPVGGQAVPGGVMMRGGDQWSLAVRRADGSIEVEVHDVPGWSTRYERIPLVRGLAALAESMSLGLQGLRTAMNKAAPADRQMTRRHMAVMAVISVPITIALFIVIPALVARPLATGHTFHLLDGVLRVTALVAYIAIVGRLPEIRSVFEYHGAEHKAVAAYEAGAPLTAAGAVPFGTRHVRCGTNFLLTVVVTTGLVQAFFGRPGWLALIGLRVVLVPLVAGLAYEWLRFAATHDTNPVVRALLVPGLALQRLTTREPSLQQLEVSMAALTAVVPVPVIPAIQIPAVQTRIAAAHEVGQAAAAGAVGS